MFMYQMFDSMLTQVLLYTAERKIIFHHFVLFSVFISNFIK